tara:strand:- start:76 stop:528 length:453 start_codon:yes stop_codon:yes gene_type:complete
MSTKNRLEKQAGLGRVLGRAVGKMSPKTLAALSATGGIGSYIVGKQAVEDHKAGRQMRKAMSKQAEHELFTREENAIFPMASESGAISARQSMLGGLLANKDKMGKLAEEQLQDLFPGGYSGSKHGYRQRSMTSSKDAGSAMLKAFKANK